MGHARADVFRRHYLHQTVKVDTQSMYLGTVSRTDLISSIGLMSARRDPRAPVKVDTAELDINNHPQILPLKEDTDRLRIDLRKKYKTLTAARNRFPDEYKKYATAMAKLRSRKKAISREELAKTRKNWFEAVDHEEIKQQLQGSQPSEFSYTEPKFHCPLRSSVASYHRGTTGIAWTDAVGTLADLCLQKAPIHKKVAEGTTMCAFCYTDNNLRASDRMHSFKSHSTLRRHINRRHAAHTISTEPIVCPYQGCKSQLDDGEHLKSHISTSHGLNIYQ